jgi:hypothetical protein
VELRFEVGNEDALFTRNVATGRTRLRVGETEYPVESPFALSTHFSLRTTRTWTVLVGEHEVRMTKMRPLLFGGLRLNRYVVEVDGQVVADEIG